MSVTLQTNLCTDFIVYHCYERGLIISGQRFRILFLSRRGSARGLIAEAIVNRFGKNRFRAVSAAVEPAEYAEPYALEVLRIAGYETDGLVPRHWLEFVGDRAIERVFHLMR